MERKLSHALEDILKEIESRIDRLILEESFYLEFRNKSWSSSEAGQKLILLSRIAINMKYDIDSLKRKGL